MTHHSIHAIAFPLVLLLLGTGGASAQTGDPGRWLAPFNHVVKPSWIWPSTHSLYGNWNKDGEIPVSANPPRFMAGHMAVIPKGTHQGSVLVWNFMRTLSDSFDKTLYYQQYWAIFNPVTGAFYNDELTLPPLGATYLSQELFCSGHAWTWNGDLVVCGGDAWTVPTGGSQTPGLLANKLCYRFDPTRPLGNAMWAKQTDMKVARWYATVTAMAEDSGPLKESRMLVAGGVALHDLVKLAHKTYETFDPIPFPGLGLWQTNPPTGLKYFPDPGAALACIWKFHGYPRQFLLSSGKVFNAGPSEKSHRVTHDNILVTAPSWEVMSSASLLSERYYGTCVLLPNLGGSNGPYRDWIMRIGGHIRFRNPASADCAEFLPQPSGVATPTVEYCDAKLSPSTLSWQPLDSMQFARVNQNAVLLPDGTVLVIGGKQDIGDEFVTANPVYPAELFNDEPGKWRTLAAMTVRRGYHFTAVLLPSGKILVGGGEQREFDYEVYEPHYLTNGTVAPIILNPPVPPATPVMNYGSTYYVEYDGAMLPMGVTVDKVVLMAPAALTHHNDMHARYVELDIDDIIPVPPPPNPRIYFKMPASSKLAPKGYFMLFLVTSPQAGAFKGTPSTAIWMQLK